MNHVAVVASLMVCLLAGCEPQVGDPCETGVDCIPNSDTCLTASLESFPGGYCTTLGCGSGSCGAGAACVVFRASIAASEECQGPLSSPRQARSFCMARCSDDEDCRDGYACIDLGRSDDPWSAEVLDFENGTQVCTLPAVEPDDGPRRSDFCDADDLEELLPDAG